jgi:hypothetical protein
METRTLLRDFQSHNQSRSVYTVEAGLVVKANKIRLLDFNIYSDSGYQNLAPLIALHPLAGVYSLIKKMSFLNLQGQEIDSMQNCINNMAVRLLHMDNGTQEGVSSVVNCTANSFFNKDSKSIISTGYTNSLSSDNGLYIDLASMLNYLNTREYLAEGFTIVIEWESQSVWAPQYPVADYGNLYISSPTLAIDEALEVSPAQVNMQPVMFTNMVHDRIYMGTSTATKITRLNSFYNQYISNLYYFNTHKTAQYSGLGFSKSENEVFEITIDGKKLLPLKGVDTPARKLAYFHDFTGMSNILSGSYMPLTYPLTVEIKGINNPTINFDNIMSYGCIKLDRFIQNDLTLSYSRTLSDDIDLTVIAEVLKMYDPKSGSLTYVKQ